MSNNAAKDFAAYARRFPKKAQKALGEVRVAIKAALPNAEETISYGMPSFNLSGKSLVGYGAFKSHIGFYPGRAAIDEFQKDLVGYESAKGSVRFPID